MPNFANAHAKARQRSGIATRAIIKGILSCIASGARILISGRTKKNTYTFGSTGLLGTKHGFESKRRVAFALSAPNHRKAVKLYTQITTTVPENFANGFVWHAITC
jgi:hypothetical protein